MVIFLVIIGLMAGIALASYFHEKRHRTSRASRSNYPNEHWDDAGEAPDDFGAEADGD
ncbi:MAG: hypothetical protein WAW39_21570 [Prosthecobacter sp.]|uniref:hypothetical protein n=1 Tax=Prosthecobacter sp. TaxID=1965333 RepID=UPI003BB1A347